MSTLKQDPMLMGAILIIGAMMYSRQAKATTATRYQAPGTGSMPGSAGTGFSQFVGGLVGSLFSKNTTITPRWQTYDPTKPSEGVSYDPADPAAVVPMQDLVNGTVHDYMTGDRSSYSVPTTQEIFSDVTGSAAPDTFQVSPGSYWSS